MPGGTGLGALAGRIRRCRLCPGLQGGFPGRGPVPARVAFVGEAPGRLGCGRTGVPFAGDRSAENFERLLARAGLRREEVFVTNAVHCVPLTAGGRNRRPSPAEIRRCRPHLLAELARARPRLVVTMGAVALGAVLGGKARPMREEVGRARRVRGFTLVPLYHPSPRVAASARSLPEQEEDFARLRRRRRPRRGEG